MLIFFCHILQGVSVLELQSDSLHTAVECCDGVDTGITCEETLRQPSTVSQCMDTPAGGSRLENGSSESSGAVDCGHGESESDWSLSVSAPKSDVCLQEHGLGPPVDWVSPVSNAERDYSQTKEEEEEQEEESEQSVGSTQSLSLCNTRKQAQSKAERESLTVGILAPVGCGKQAEETDEGGVEAVIREGQGATEGEETSEQEAENSATSRKEEDTDLESTELITPIGETKDSVMGQSSSSEGSDSETKERLQEGEGVDKEGMKNSLEPADGLFADKGLTDCVSTPGDVPCPSLIDCGDVIEGPESAVPCLLIQGLHEGEPPPDINSLEQNQETAVGDYAIEQRQGLAPETGCHSGICTETVSVEELGGEHRADPSGHSTENASLPSLDARESTSDCGTAAHSMEENGRDPSCEMMPSCIRKHADLESEMTRSLSSEDDDSFRSVGSSSTEIFHPTQDNVGQEDQECPETRAAEVSSTGFKPEEPSERNPTENNEQVLTVDEGFSSEHAGVAVVTETDSRRSGTQSESQLSSCLQTTEALTTEGTGEELDPQQSKEGLLLDPESGDAPVQEVAETESGEAKDSNSDGGIKHLESEVSTRVFCEDSPSVAGKCEVIDRNEGDLQPAESGDKSATVSDEESGDMSSVSRETEQDNSEMTVDKTPHDEGLRPPQCGSEESSSQSVTSVFDNPDAEPSGEPNGQPCQNPLDTVDAASPSDIQGGQTLSLFQFHIHMHTLQHNVLN